MQRDNPLAGCRFAIGYDQTPNPLFLSYFGGFPIGDFRNSYSGIGLHDRTQVKLDPQFLSFGDDRSHLFRRVWQDVSVDFAGHLHIGHRIDRDHELPFGSFEYGHARTLSYQPLPRDPVAVTMPADGTDGRQTAISPGHRQLTWSFTPGNMVVKTLGSKPGVSRR